MKRVVKNGQPGSRQAYQNKTKFNPNKYKADKERLSPQILFKMTSLCCTRCCQVLQWKVDYGKYTPLQRARKCNRCGELNVQIAYHRICQGCAQREGRCSKCQKIPLPPTENQTPGASLEDDDDEEEEEENQSAEGDYESPSAETTRETPVSKEVPSSLQYLDTRYIEKLEGQKKREEEQMELSRLRERDRRTAIRKKQQERRSAGEEVESISDDSDVVL